MLFFFLGVILGVIFCVLIYAITSSKKKVGYLRIDRSDQDGPLLFLELETDILSLSKKKRVILKIKNESFMPREKQPL